MEVRLTIGGYGMKNQKFTFEEQWRKFKHLKKHEMEFKFSRL